jgi:(R,R)-butanediol dehydrogenase/meso-butanediol dehydrogenase/diacetyl reductase
VIKVSHCGICGSDLHTTEDPFFKLPSGIILGHELAGEVIETGKDVDRVKVGDQVAVMPIQSCGQCASCLSGEPAWCSTKRLYGGGYAQVTSANQRQLMKLPVNVSARDGSLVEPMAVGLHGVMVSDLKPDARVLIIGAGPVGLAVAFWARRLGAGKVAVTASSMQRAQLAYEMGATHFLDPNDSDAEGVKAALGGMPDIVYECVGKPGLVQRAVELCRIRGTVVVLGLCSALDSFMPIDVVRKELRVQAAAFFNLREFQACVDMLDSGAVGPRAMITDTVSLDAMPTAFEALRSRTTQCKVLVATN